MAHATERQRCPHCKAWIASDHPGPLCSACQTASTEQSLTPPDLPAEFWLDDGLQAALGSWHMGKVIRAYRHHPHHGRRGISQDVVAGWAQMSQPQLSDIERGTPINDLGRLISWAVLLGIPERYLWFKLPTPDIRSVRSQARTSTELVAAQRPTAAPAIAAADTDSTFSAGPDLGGIEAIELLRQIEASDVGPQTVAAIGTGVDGLCRSFSSAAPGELLGPLRTYQQYLAQLLDGRMTLAQRRELLRHAGWLSLLAATASMDVGHDRAAEANFVAAAGLATEVGDLSLAAWVLETRAWQALTVGDYPKAARLCREGLDVAPHETPAHVQLCTQAARATARLGNAVETYRHVDEALSAVDDLPTPDAPEHHFACDQQKVLAFCAAALVWLDDDHDTAEDHARRAVAQYESPSDEQGRPHHLATARMNLALVLARRGEPEEATHLGGLVLESAWRLCRTDLFLTDDLHQTLYGRYQGDRAVTEFHDRYLDIRATIEDVETNGPAAATDRLELTSGQLAAPPGS